MRSGGGVLSEIIDDPIKCLSHIKQKSLGEWSLNYRIPRTSSIKFRNYFFFTVAARN